MLLLTGGFALRSGGDVVPTNLSGSGAVVFASSSQSFTISGRAGYFLTRKHELGGGIGLSVFHFKSCVESFSNGQITDKTCDSNASASFGLSGFYRYNFAREGAKRFPFAGFDASVGDLVHRDFTGNVQVRPNVGYKYFLKRNVALDFSVGYRMDVNKFSSPSFTDERSRTVDGQVGLAFVF